MLSMVSCSLLSDAIVADASLLILPKFEATALASLAAAEAPADAWAFHAAESWLNIAVTLPL
jgi:hypothetical protein